MNAPGSLLDTGPLVSLLLHQDQNHERARKIFLGAVLRSKLAGCFDGSLYLIQRVRPESASLLISLALKEFYVVDFQIKDHWLSIKRLMQKYSDVPISLADACLVRCAEVYNEPRIITF